MAFLGLSGDALTFLGGVATGASKEIDRQLERQQEAIKEASSEYKLKKVVYCYKSKIGRKKEV